MKMTNVTGKEKAAVVGIDTPGTESLFLNIKEVNMHLTS